MSCIQQSLWPFKILYDQGLDKQIWKQSKGYSEKGCLYLPCGVYPPVEPIYLDNVHLIPTVAWIAERDLKQKQTPLKY